MELARHLYRAAHARHVERGAAGAREFSVDETKIEGGVVRDERRIAEEFDQLVDARREQGLVRQKLDRQAVYRFGGGGHVAFGIRSEEHTSELQSLMRISYAVFCLKKKKREMNALIAL